MAVQNSAPVLTKQLAVGFLVESLASLWSLCTEQASRASRKCTEQANRASRRLVIQCRKQAAKASRRLAHFPAAQHPNQLIAAISHRAIQLRLKKRIADAPKDGGVWQRTIMMGDKCQPLNFPGVIYYDSDGNRMSELPIKSPRASPMPNYALKMITQN